MQSFRHIGAPETGQTSAQTQPETLFERLIIVSRPKSNNNRDSLAKNVPACGTHDRGVQEIFTNVAVSAIARYWGV